MKRKIALTLAILVLVATCVAALTACMPTSLAGAKRKLEKEDFKISDWTYEGLDGLKGSFKAKGTDPVCEVYVMYFKSADDAKKAYEIVKAEKEVGFTHVKQNGKWVYYGDSLGIEYFEY